MWDRLFSNRLRKEFPRWVEHGWVTPENQRLILEQVSSHVGGARRAPVALAVLGVLLFGAGVITFFAANWAEISKLTKLIVLFGSLWSAYAAAGWFLAREGTPEQRFGHALLLLGVILFGANIMLIAQTYHIAAHFPTGVLLWTLGALLVVYLVPTQLAGVAGLVLAGLWSGLELGALADLERLTVHWPFLVIWVLFLPQVYRRSWKHAATLAVLAFLVWGVANLGYLAAKTEADALYVVQIVFLASLCLFLLGGIMERTESLLVFAPTVRRQGALAGLVSFYILSMRTVHGFGLSLSAPQVPGEGWIVGTIAAVVAVVALAALLLWRTESLRQLPYLWWGHGLSAAIILLLLVNLVRPGGETYPAAAYILSNVFFLGGVVWLIYAGYRSNDGLQVNLSFLFFAIWVLTLYFDTFWTLMDRSFFFMGGGVILFVGGYLLERQRRNLLRRVEHEKHRGERR